jgi:hypothetical protein
METRFSWLTNVSELEGLVEGFRWAFYAGAVLAVLGALIRAKASGDGEPRSGHAARG